MSDVSKSLRETKRKHVSSGKKDGKKRRVENQLCLSTMPLDNLYQIFLDLLPVDLMHISRVNKNLRCVLLNRSSIFVWKKSLERFPDFPECPENMNIPQLVNLVCGYHCNFCDHTEQQLKKRKVALRESYQYGFRICDTCIPEHMKLTTSMPGYNVEGIVPKLTIKTNRYNDYFWPPVRSRLKEQSEKFPKRSNARKVWIAEQQNALSFANALESQVVKWKAGEPERLLAAREEVNKRILEEMKKRLVDLGWGAELHRELTDKFYSTALFNGIKFSDLHAPLLPEEWEAARPQLEKYLEQRRAVRLSRFNKSRIKNAVDVTETILFEYSQTNYIVPPAIEILFRQPVLDAIFAFLVGASVLDSQKEVLAERDPLKQAIRAALPDLHATVQEWRLEREKQVLAIAAKSPSFSKYIRDPENPASTLRLAISVFVHRDRYYRSDSRLSYPRILIHNALYGRYHQSSNKSTTLTSFADYTTTEAKQELIQATTSSPVWNGQDTTVVYDDYVRVLESLVRVCGMDPSTATHAQLNSSVDLLLRCLHPRCNTRGGALKDRPYFLKSKALSHWIERHALGSKNEEDWGEGDCELFQIVDNDPEALDLFGSRY